MQEKKKHKSYLLNNDTFYRQNKYKPNRNGMKKHFSIIIMSLLFSSALSYADEQEKHEVSISGSGGFVSFRQKLTEGLHSLKPGGACGIKYNYFFNDAIGIGTGFEISFHKSTSTFENLSESYMANDGTDDFEFRATIPNYDETQSAVFINIPIMLQLQYPLFDDDHLAYFAIGGKIGIPTQESYKITSTSFTTSGYYPEYNLLLEEPKSQGFGTFTIPQQKGDFKFKTALMVSAEVGMKWELGKYFSLYTGLYADYGLNNVNNTRSKRPILVYNEAYPTNYYFNSVVNARYAKDGNRVAFSDKISPISFGLSIRFAFRIPEY